MARLKIQKRFKSSPFSFYFIILAIVSGCTSSPISENSDIDVPKRQIAGNVALMDGANSEGTFIWFEGFNTSTRVDQLGNFELSIPPKQAQGGTNGISGTFKIYYYIANYELASSNIVTRNGEFVFLSGDLNDNGKLTPITLERNLRIHTKVAPDSVSTDYTGFIDVEVSLVANKPVNVEFPFTFSDQFGAILACCDSTNQIYTFKAFPDLLISSTIEVQDSLITRSLSFTLSTFDLPVGEYEIIPYLFVNRDDIPSELLLNLGDTVKALSREYLNMPLKRTGGSFEITTVR